jgi:hypothetical protein
MISVPVNSENNPAATERRHQQHTDTRALAKPRGNRFPNPCHFWGQLSAIPLGYYEAGSIGS